MSDNKAKVSDWYGTRWKEFAKTQFPLLKLNFNFNKENCVLANSFVKIDFIHLIAQGCAKSERRKQEDSIASGGSV